MDYYKILGVSYGASRDEIKRAYRRLAVMYHPDKNQDPAAENIFKNINAAYDVLGDPAKRNLYDLKRQSPFSEAPPEAQHRDPAYGRNRPRVHRKGDRERLHEVMQTYMPWAIRILQVCFVFSMLVLVDYSLPARVTKEQIVGTGIRHTYSRNYSTTWWVIKTDGHHTIDVTYEFSDHFANGREVSISSTMLFDVPRKVESDTVAVRLKKSIYGNFLFAPIALIFFSALGIFFRKNVEFGFNLSVVSGLILIFTIVLLLTL